MDFMCLVTGKNAVQELPYHLLSLDAIWESDIRGKGSLSVHESTPHSTRTRSTCMNTARRKKHKCTYPPASSIVAHGNPPSGRASLRAQPPSIGTKNLYQRLKGPLKGELESLAALCRIPTRKGAFSLGLSSPTSTKTMPNDNTKSERIDCTEA